MKKCQKHSYKDVGITNCGWGYSTSCIVKWCKICGTVRVGPIKTIRPEILKKALRKAKSK